MNLREFMNNWKYCPGYTNNRIGRKNLWRCDYYLPNGIDYQRDKLVVTTWDSYNTTICGVDYRVTINSKPIIYVGAYCTYSPTTRQHTSYIARELGFSYYDFKHALNAPNCRITNDKYTLVYSLEQNLFNDKLNRSSACNLMQYYNYAHGLGFLNDRETIDFHTRGVDMQDLRSLTPVDMLNWGLEC